MTRATVFLMVLLSVLLSDGSAQAIPTRASAVGALQGLDNVFGYGLRTH